MPIEGKVEKGGGRRRALLPPLAALLAGCSYLGTARDFDPAELGSDPGWVAAPGVPLVLQEKESDCGAAALAMVLSYWDVPTTAREVFEACGSPAGGIGIGALRDFAEKKGLRAYMFFSKEASVLEKELSKRRPVIVGVVKPHATFALTHYEVVVGLHPRREIVVTLDPAAGWRQNTCEGFLKEWQLARNVTMVVFKGEGDPK